jgi:uncharacterized membrane-anchored protein
MNIPFKPVWFGALLLLSIVFAFLGGINDYATGSIIKTFGLAWQERNVWLMIVAVLTAVMFLWLLLVFMSMAWQKWVVKNPKY